jgi:hypothetical protein
MILRSLSGIIAAALSLLAVLAVGTFAAAGEPKWVTYRSPSGFYSVEHPGDWRVERDDNIVNIFPDGDGGAVTISAYVGKPARSDPKQLISKVFGTRQATSPLFTVTGSGWKGVRRAFLDTSHTPHIELVVVVAANASGMVIITWNERSPRTPKWAPLYTRIFDSLELSTPRL